MKKLILIIAFIFSFTSCTVYRTISFNADHSGNVDSRVDMTAMFSMMGEYGGSSGGMGSMSGVEDFDKSKAQLESIAGISNVKVSFDTTGILYTSYDFASTEALVNAMSSGDMSNSMMMGMGGGKASAPKAKITYKGKKFYMEEIDKKALKSMQSEDIKKDLGEMDMLLSSSSINTTINFPAAVRKVSYKNASITNDKSVNFVMPVKDLISKDYKPLTVNLK